MPNKDYDVAKRFTEVARRAREINTAPKKKPEPKSEFDANAYVTRPGRLSPKPSKDVNLPIETASPEVRKRLADSLRKKR